MIVGTKEAPPFAMKGPGGCWIGIRIEPRQEIAAKLGLRYEFRDSDLDRRLAGVTNGSMDAAVAAITVTSVRERIMDFTPPLSTPPALASPRPPPVAHHGRQSSDGSSPPSFWPPSACWPWCSPVSTRCLGSEE